MSALVSSVAVYGRGHLSVKLGTHAELLGRNGLYAAMAAAHQQPAAAVEQRAEIESEPKRLPVAVMVPHPPVRERDVPARAPPPQRSDLH